MILTALVAVAVLAVDPPEWVVRLEKPTEGSAFAIAADGLRFAVARDTNWIDIYYRGEVENSVRCNDGDRVVALAFTDNGKSLAAGCQHSNQLRIWDVMGGQQRLAVTTKTEGIRAIAFHPREASAYCGGSNGTICAVDLRTGVERFALPEPSTAIGYNFNFAMCFHPSGRMLACGSSRHDIGHFWNLHDRTQDLEFPMSSSSQARHSLAFDRTGRMLLIVGPNDVEVRETAIRGRRWYRDIQGATKGATWSDDGRFIAVASDAGLVEILDGEAGIVLATHARGGTCEAIAAAGGKLVTLGADQTVRFLHWPKAGAPRPDSKVRTIDPNDIRNANSEVAYRTMQLLQTDPALVVRLAMAQLEPIPTLSVIRKAEVGKSVARLAHDDFDTRQSASQKLRELAPTAGLEIRRAAAKETDPEALYRLRQLLQDATIPLFDPPVTVSQARWLELLERVNTPAARTIVERLTKGDPDAELTLDAVDTLHRMKPRR